MNKLWTNGLTLIATFLFLYLLFVFVLLRVYAVVVFSWILLLALTPLLFITSLFVLEL